MKISDKYTNLVIIAGGNFSLLGTRLLIGSVVPFILIEFGAGKSGIGIALTGLWATASLAQFPSGILSDRYGERIVMLFALGATALGSGLIALSNTLVALAVFFMILGIGSGFFFTAASSMVTRLFDNHGGPLAFLTAFGTLSGIVYPTMGGIFSVRYGWRTVVLASAVVAGLIFLSTERLIPGMPSVGQNQSLTVEVDLARNFDILTRAGILSTIVIAVVVTFFFQAFSSFFPTFLIEHRGVGPGLAGVLFGVALGLSALAQPLSGRISDKFSRNLAITGSVILLIIGILILIAIPGRIALYGGITVLGVGITWPGPIQAKIMDHLDDFERGYGFGLVRTVYLLAASSASAIVGFLSEAGGWTLAFGVIVWLLFGCLLILISKQWKQPRFLSI